ncbi:MAG: PAS domain S-box protein [Nitrospinae bacterium]|nr:PAS domain S-box protein [Nitrospinota bacterium]
MKEKKGIGGAISRPGIAAAKRKGYLGSSESLHRAVIETALDAIFIMDDRGIVESFNPAASRMFGYSSEEAMGMDIRTLSPSLVEPGNDGLPTPRIKDDGTIAAGVGGVLRARRKDGTDFWIYLSIGEMTFDGARKLTGIARDVTEQKDAMCATLEKYRTIFENVQDVFYRTDMEGRLTEISPSIFRYSQYRREELMGLPVTLVCPNPAERSGLLAVLGRDGEVADYEVTLRRKDGTTVPVSVNCHLVFDGNQKPTAIEGSLRDITERKAAELALRASEGKTRAIMETTANGIITIYENGIIDTFNHGAERMFGWAAGEVIGHNVKALMPEPDHSMHDGYLRRHRETGENKIIGVGLEAVGKKKDGTTFPIHLAISEILLGQAKGYVGTITDLTALKSAENELRENVAKLRLITDTMTEVFWSTDVPFTRILYVSPAYERVWERSCQSLYEDPGSFLESVHPEDVGKITPDQLKQNNGVGFDHEYRIVMKDGRIKWIWERGFPVRDENGKLYRYVGVAQDVTDRKKVAAALSLLTEELAETLEVSENLRKEAETDRERAEEANRLKTGFLNTISHELRTPLTVILGNLPLICDERDMPAAAETAEIARDIERSGKHLLVLINDLLDLSKIEAGKMDLQPEMVGLTAFVEEVLQAGRGFAKNKNKSLEFKAEILDDVVAPADPVRLNQILLNLVGNAVKFTDQGSITVSVRRDGEWAEIVVRDTGCGIKAEHCSAIFEAFRQVDSSSTRKSGGTGLGLAITRRLAELHGGSVSVTSVVGQGSAFTVRLPLNAGRQTAEADKPAVINATDDSEAHTWPPKS